MPILLPDTPWELIWELNKPIFVGEAVRLMWWWGPGAVPRTCGRLLPEEPAAGPEGRWGVSAPGDVTDGCGPCGVGPRMPPRAGGPPLPYGLRVVHVGRKGG